MFRSIKIGRILGVDLRIHFTFFLFLAWIAMMHWSRGGPAAAVQGVTFIILLFACVVLHEFGHILAARSFGIPTADVTLLPIGGVARLQRIPERPWQEFVVAIAGPLVNVVIFAILIFILGRQTNFEDFEQLELPGGQMLAKLASVNIGLVIFNLIPAFPMDGGRILRSLLAMTMNYGRATLMAARVGQTLAVLFGIMGFLGSPMLIFIAFFVYVGAQQELLLVQSRESEWTRPPHPWRTPTRY